MFDQLKGFALAAGIAVVTATAAVAAPPINQPAPLFDGVDSNGEAFSLADYQGQTVILEWTNHDCPYVKKHYGANNMQALQEAAVEADRVWVTVVSSAPGKQGHVSGDEANELTQDRRASPARVLLDESGAIGRLYDARTTPHMFIIDPEGVLRYNGAIDSIADADPASIPGAVNYVTAALANLDAGEPVADPITTPYGCSIKY